MKVGLPARKEDRLYSYGDYKGWPDDERWELIDGVAWNMSPSPSLGHQALSMELGHLIRSFVGKGGCRVFAAPCDVLLPDLPDQPEDEVRSVVQPDIIVVCDPSRLRAHGCVGAPDWVIEILSPYTSRKDMVLKLSLYERHGVREYWIIDPGNRCVHVHLLGNNGRYPEPELFVEKAVIRASVCNGFQVELNELFAAMTV